MAFVELTVHILANLVHGHVSGAFYQDLDIVFPGFFSEFAEHIEFQELGAVVGIMYGARTHTIAERYGNVVFSENLAYLIEVGVKKIFLIVHDCPACHDGSATAYTSGKTLAEHLGMFLERTGMDCEIVHSLFGLFYQRITVYFPCKVLDAAINLFKRLIHRYSTDRNGAVAYNPLAGFVYVIAC